MLDLFPCLSTNLLIISFRIVILRLIFLLLLLTFLFYSSKVLNQHIILLFTTWHDLVQVVIFLCFNRKLYTIDHGHFNGWLCRGFKSCFFNKVQIARSFIFGGTWVVWPKWLCYWCNFLATLAFGFFFGFGGFM